LTETVLMSAIFKIVQKFPKLPFKIENEGKKRYRVNLDFCCLLLLQTEEKTSLTIVKKSPSIL
jgi:hypothetical protein